MKKNSFMNLEGYKCVHDVTRLDNIAGLQLGNKLIQLKPNANKTAIDEKKKHDK